MNAQNETVLWTAKEVAGATNGRHTGSPEHGHWQAAGVSIDSRTIVPGDLFVALRGPHFDGHNFVAQAFASGAVAALVDRLPEGLTADAPLVKVDDSFAALNDLATAARARSRARICVVTGSVGKTGTKEALRLLLSRQGPTTASRGNLNNHWGFPLSLARLPTTSRYGVFEMGMNHTGELAPLSRLARPHLAVVTSIEAVHSANFASIDEIALAKAEIFQGLESGGTAIINRDSPHYPLLAQAAESAGAAQIIGFGYHQEAQARIVRAHPFCEGWRVEVDILGQPMAFDLSLPGRHLITNATCALAAVAAMGADPQTAADDLVELEAKKGRGKIHVIALDKGLIRLIDESYNASPVSVRAAIDVLARLEPGENGRRIAVLGDMLEIGDDSQRLHAQLATELSEAGVNQVFLVGEAMRNLYEALPKTVAAEHFTDTHLMASAVTDDLKAGDLVMIKGSRGMQTDVVVDAITALNTERDSINDVL